MLTVAVDDVRCLPVLLRSLASGCNRPDLSDALSGLERRMPHADLDEHTLELRHQIRDCLGRIELSRDSCRERVGSMSSTVLRRGG